MNIELYFVMQRELLKASLACDKGVTSPVLMIVSIYREIFFCLWDFHLINNSKFLGQYYWVFPCNILHNLSKTYYAT